MFENEKKSIPRDMLCIADSLWKSGEDSRSGDQFYSSIGWNMVAHNKYKFEYVDKKINCKPEENLFYSCADGQCVNYACNIERYRNCVCGEACRSKRFAGNAFKHVTVFNVNSKWLGLKSNEQPVSKEEFINEHVGLAMSIDKLLALFNDDGSERMACTM